MQIALSENVFFVVLANILTSETSYYLPVPVFGTGIAFQDSDDPSHQPKTKPFKGAEIRPCANPDAGKR